MLINDKLSQTYFNAFIAIFFRTRIIRILPSEIKYVLYVRSHYAADGVEHCPAGT